VTGRVALVTGGSGALGSELCRTLSRRGATVAVTGRDEARIAAVVESLPGAGAGFRADCAAAGDVARLRAEVEASLGPVDLLACFAGEDVAERPLVETTDAEWEQALAASLTSTFVVLREFLPGMYERRRGAVVLMSSTAARRQTPASAGYTAAKGGILALTRKAAAEAGPHGVRVTCLAPSLIATEGRDVPYDDETIAAGWPLGRLGTPRDVADAAAFLLSDEAGWLTGVTLDVAGGRVMP
jgi:3-oxoacyl-[acyl-carrier protein] reductase